jgi:hypothetical protein
MQAGLAPLLHDASVLHALADFIEQYCGEQERTQRYIDASGEFFRYSKELASGIKAKLLIEVKRAQDFPKREANVRRYMLTFKGYLRVLHTFIKPAADAHTLSIPAPLINLACDHLRRIDGMRESKVVVLLTPELMYFQRPHTHVKEEAAKVQRRIPDAVFPVKLGFIELPYSQGPNFFPNLAIYHEIGHFVYEELTTAPSVLSEFSSLERVTNEVLNRFTTDPDLRRLAERILGSWTQEIFCDLLALRLVGPAFSFALVEILALLNLLSPRATTTFTQEHPAPAYRLCEHLRFLRDESGWWNAIATLDASQKRLLESLAGISHKRYTVYPDDAPKYLISPFRTSIVPAIRQLVACLVPEVASVVDKFIAERDMVERCLSVGVVPHASNSTPPDPVSIINSAFCFYLMKLPGVVTEFEGKNKESDVKVRSKWSRKLEGWTLKALEDSQVRAQFERR